MVGSSVLYFSKWQFKEDFEGFAFLDNKRKGSSVLFFSRIELRSVGCGLLGRVIQYTKFSKSSHFHKSINKRKETFYSDTNRPISFRISFHRRRTKLKIRDIIVCLKYKFMKLTGIRITIQIHLQSPILYRLYIITRLSLLYCSRNSTSFENRLNSDIVRISNKRSF